MSRSFALTGEQSLTTGSLSYGFETAGSATARSLITDIAADGGAWATTGARTFLAVVMLGYIAMRPEFRALGVFDKPERNRAAEAEQRRVSATTTWTCRRRRRRRPPTWPRPRSSWPGSVAGWRPRSWRPCGQG